MQFASFLQPYFMFIVALENLPKKHLLFDALQIIKLFVKVRTVKKANNETAWKKKTMEIKAALF